MVRSVVVAVRSDNDDRERYRENNGANPHQHGHGLAQGLKDFTRNALEEKNKSVETERSTQRGCSRIEADPIGK